MPLRVGPAAAWLRVRGPGGGRCRHRALRLCRLAGTRRDRRFRNARLALRAAILPRSAELLPGPLRFWLPRTTCRDRPKARREPAAGLDVLEPEPPRRVAGRSRAVPGRIDFRKEAPRSARVLHVHGSSPPLRARRRSSVTGSRGAALGLAAGVSRAHRRLVGRTLHEGASCHARGRRGIVVEADRRRRVAVPRRRRSLPISPDPDLGRVVRGGRRSLDLRHEAQPIHRGRSNLNFRAREYSAPLLSASYSTPHSDGSPYGLRVRLPAALAAFAAVALGAIELFRRRGKRPDGERARSLRFAAGRPRLASTT